MRLEADVQEMENTIQKMVTEKGFSGSILVKKGGERLIFDGYGDENIGVNTRFCIASMTKHFTGVAIMLLVQEGRLALDDEINTALPIRFRGERWKGITIRHLMTHSSGLHNEPYSHDDMNHQEFFSLDEILAPYLNSKFSFNPGTMFRYSNGNYDLLGAIIEECSKKSYEAFMHERIFQRPGIEMRATGMAASYAEAPPATGYYVGAEGEKKRIDQQILQIYLSKAYAGGSIISTLADMERWDEALYDDSFLTPASRKEMADAKPRVLFDPENRSYSRDAQGRFVPKEGEEYDLALYGLGIGIEENGAVEFHGGAVPGFTSFIIRNTDARDCVIALGNRDMECACTEDVARRLWAMLCH